MSASIQILDPLVAERIAAGEVVERPASVVKELLENAIDAGATKIHVRLEDGGKALIEITDNGSGMSPDDLALCMARHATSKIRALEDFDSLHTLGFRGEALPSIAACADLEILSRTASADSAGKISSESGSLSRSGPEPVTFGTFLGSVHGTRITARGLFSRLPARLKFLKSKSSEVSAVREWMERLSFTHPEISFELSSDDRSVFHLRSGTMEDRIRTILSDGNDYPIVTIALEHTAPFTGPIEAYWIQGLQSSQTRKLIQVVNGRVLRDKLIQSALLGAFAQTSLPGQYPALVVRLSVDPREMDVNVHPTKTEVRFRDSSAIYRGVRHALESLIQSKGAAQWMARDSGTRLSPSQNTAETPSFSFRASHQDKSAEPSTVHEMSAVLTRDISVHVLPVQAMHYRGSLFKTYLLFDEGSELILIDQHAAHERIRFEQLSRRYSQPEQDSTPIAAQQLLIPEVVAYASDRTERLEARLPALQKAGFDAEIFGEGSLLFRALPADWLARVESSALRPRLSNLIDRLLDSEATELRLDKTLFEALASEACHSAVRARDSLTAEQAIALTEQLLRCEHPWNCPHGRPTVVRIPEARLEEWFQRRVPH